MAKGLADRYEGTNVSLSLPSTRVDAFNITLANEFSRNGRRSGLTFAPEGGSTRMRKVINKAVDEDDLIRTVATAYSNGWRQVKLYFMCGLPTETDDDVLEIADLATKVIAKGREVTGHNDIRCTVSIGGFVPKPHTPFQWASQLDHETTDERLKKLRDVVRADKRYARAIGFRYHDGKPGIIEGLLSRGDRRVGRIIEEVWRDGGRFDGWSEHFSYDRWLAASERALAGTGVDLDWYTVREREYDEVLPWDHLDSGLDKDWLWSDWEDALAVAENPDACPMSRTADGRRATTAASAPRWTPRSRSVPPAGACCRSPSCSRLSTVLCWTFHDPRLRSSRAEKGHPDGHLDQAGPTFEPPGPGSWDLDRCTSPARSPPTGPRCTRRPFSLGYGDMMAFYGTPFQTRLTTYVSGFCYGQMQPVPPESFPDACPARRGGVRGQAVARAGEGVGGGPQADLRPGPPRDPGGRPRRAERRGAGGPPAPLPRAPRLDDPAAHGLHRHRGHPAGRLPGPRRASGRGCRR